jgi:hypothetical protein
MSPCFGEYTHGKQKSQECKISPNKEKRWTQLLDVLEPRLCIVANCRLLFWVSDFGGFA